jgi:hypothetical protein
MNEARTMTADKSVIIGELHADFFCITSMTGLVHQVNMHTPVSQRAIFMDELFNDTLPYLSFSLKDTLRTQNCLLPEYRYEK